MESQHMRQDRRHYNLRLSDLFSVSEEGYIDFVEKTKGKALLEQSRTFDDWELVIKLGKNCKHGKD